VIIELLQDFFFFALAVAGIHLNYMFLPEYYACFTCYWIKQ